MSRLHRNLASGVEIGVGLTLLAVFAIGITGLVFVPATPTGEFNALVGLLLWLGSGAGGGVAVWKGWKGLQSPLQRLDRPRLPMQAGVRRVTRAAFVLVAVLVHIVLVAAIGAIALTLPTDGLAILAAGMIVLIMTFLTVVYLHNFGAEPVEMMREGSIGLTRAYLLFVSWATLGYLAIIVALGSELQPSGFLLALLGFFALFAIFLSLVVVWRRQNPPRWT